jgi:hypothetical protein
MDVIGTAANPRQNQRQVLLIIQPKDRHSRQVQLPKTVVNAQKSVQETHGMDGVID